MADSAVDWPAKVGQGWVAWGAANKVRKAVSRVISSVSMHHFGERDKTDHLESAITLL